MALASCPWWGMDSRPRRAVDIVCIRRMEISYVRGRGILPMNHGRVGHATNTGVAERRRHRFRVT
ncbi:MAG: hypothetical protein HOP29_08900 [Phycisphaerales bacterium]|nr:hypothetical protein [Phycisphaerales bacterium]